ncbi:phospholipase A1-II 1-like [Eucalyptus grandis]|uniref:phospholipase A1-II 1-like n=1 Tax=Eucalyptus grandis TaxID=71139 RepID=UPI00192EC360|nr:phospholipase A1-II 1-like [Eucalyptus grandis]
MFFAVVLSREAWNKESNWAGYVAGATDQDADTAADAVANDVDGIIPKVHSGFPSVYTSDDPHSGFNKTSARKQVLTEVQWLVDQYKQEENQHNHCGPQPRSSACIAECYQHSLERLQQVVRHPITTPSPEPPCRKSQILQYCQLHPKPAPPAHCQLARHGLKVPVTGYFDAGQELLINTQLSKYLKYLKNIYNWHSLEAYLHGLAGRQGTKGGFKLEVKRDMAPVNKHHSFLRDEYLVPDEWWVMMNRRMVQI